MKKIIITLIIFTVVWPAVFSPVFAQSDSEDNKLYYVNVHLEKVYPSGKGYIVQYRKGINQIGTIGIPNEWFSAAASKAELVNLPPGRNWPTLSIFYKNGEFSHCRLYVHVNRGHPTWGNIPQSMDVSSYFQDPEKLNIVY
ncbi:MAG: hypothetical protein LBH16_00645 [Treponema sp.]|jgi:hypothetical protein|nr:hypothetical protein [Treponema sp.]